jgi:hypothetical protein
MTFPDDGEIYPAQHRQSRQLIFFAHFYQGHKKALRRHIELVNLLGFDAYAFNLQDSPKAHYYLPYSHVSKKFGMKHALADQIEMHFNLLSQYKEKIVFAFSNVSACCFEFMARQFEQGHRDIVGMICDSGPGKSFIYSSYKLLEHQFGIKSLPLKLLGTPAVALGWSPSLHKDIDEDLYTFPQGFPLLSIRGWKDTMISPQHIDSVFDPHPQIHWRKLSLPDAGHLNGLRDYPQEYQAGLETFLKSISKGY